MTDKITTQLQSRVSLAHRAIARKRAFTLIELLVVIALTVVLVALLFGPLVAGFEYTSRAQTLSAAQDGQRLLINQIKRDLASAAGVRDTQDKYLNVTIVQKSDTNLKSGIQATAHMYNAYTDIVPPLGNCQDAQSIKDGLCNGSPIITDPTTNEQVIIKTDTTTGNSYGVSPGIVTPIAPGTTFTRYFIGLKYPFSPLTYAGAGPVSAAPYNNIYDNQMESASDGTYGTTDIVQQNLNNTYVLYSATVSPYKATTDPTQVSQPNTDLFATDSSGKPVLDDPDFFRIVSTTDLIPGTTTQYGATAGGHNRRVYNWYKVSHQAITGREYDLLQYARAGGKILYDSVPTSTVSGTNTLNVIDPYTKVAYTNVGLYSNTKTTTEFSFDTTNTVSGNAVLKVRPSFLILPGGVAGETTQATAVDDVSNGVQSSGNNIQSGQYIPTVYATSQQQVQGTPTFTLTGDGGPYATKTATSGDVGTALVYTGTSTANGRTIATGDLVEYVASDTTQAPVYDITQNSAVTGAASYIACSFNATSGQINFAISARPGASDPANGDAGNTLNTWWAARLQAVDTTGETYVDIGDPNVFATNPLSNNVLPLLSVVVNSERIRGPDRSSGPAKYFRTNPGDAPITFPLVSYTRVPLGTPIGVNQYSIVYYNPQTFTPTTGPSAGIPVTLANARIFLGPDAEWSSTLSSAGTTLNAQNTILLSYNVQNNVATSGSGASATPAPAAVSASYATSNAMQVTAGLRVYDPVSSVATFITNTTTVPVGNGTR